MTPDGNSLFDLLQLMMQKEPQVVSLLTAQSDSEFDIAFDSVLGKAIAHLEQNSKKFKQLDEEGLSAVLAASLSMPWMSVFQEANSNGHVDITIEINFSFSCRRKLCEAKIYKGPEYHVQGLGQLLQRYTTGREGRGLLIAYVRMKDISGLIKKIRQKMDSEHPCDQQGDTVDHTFKWSFLSRHAHSCGDVLDVSHVGCNLYSAPAA
jgi:hypothetical protein